MVLCTVSQETYMNQINIHGSMSNSNISGKSNRSPTEGQRVRKDMKKNSMRCHGRYSGRRYVKEGETIVNNASTFKDKI